VKDAGVVGVGEAAADGDHQVGRLVRIDPHAVGRVVERFPRHILHHDVEHAADLAGVVDGDQVRVVEPGHRAGFGGERLAEGCVRAELGREDFDRDVAVERLLPRLIHRAHAALGDQVVEGVSGQQGVQGFERRGFERGGELAHRGFRMG